FFLSLILSQWTLSSWVVFLAGRLKLQNPALNRQVGMDGLPRTLQIQPTTWFEGWWTGTQLKKVADPELNDAESTISVEFTPTIPHCSMAMLTGLSVKVKLIRSLPKRFKVDVHITAGTHASEHAVNKQLTDKERVAAALEKNHLLEMVNQCLQPSVSLRAKFEMGSNFYLIPRRLHA
uniref:Uncharacterized protein n=1 Tax=Podarcis muralis TaxID=64176 RepID=A0A670JKQ5_PODMU